MWIVRGIWLSALAMAGCAGLQTQQDAAASGRSGQPSDAALAVSVQGWVATPQDAQGRALRPDDALGEQDRVSLRIEVSQPAYVYVVQSSATLGSTQLFPESEHRQVAAAKTLRIPESAERTLGVSPTGSGERFLVVASRKPLSLTTCTLLALRCGTAVDRGRGGDDQNKRNTQDPDKRGDRFAVNTAGSEAEQITVVTYSLIPRQK